MADKENGKALVDEIKNAPTPDQIKESSPLVVPAEPKSEVKVEVPEEVKAAAAAPAVVDKSAQDRIAAEQKAIKKAEKEQAKKQAKIDKKAKQAAEFQAKIEQCPKDYRPVTTGVFFWCGLLCALPVIGVVFTILFALIPRNKNFKNFARALLAWYLIFFIVMLVFALVITLVMGQDIADYIWPFEQFFSDLASAFGY
jgi:hypothetical protein